MKSGEKIKVLDSACVEVEIKDNLPMLSSKIGGRKVKLFRSSGVVIRRELVDKADFIGETRGIMSVDRAIKRALMARVEVDTSFYVGTVETLFFLFDLLECAGS